MGNWMLNAIKFKKIQVNGTLSRTRDFLFITDAINEIVLNSENNLLIIPFFPKYLILKSSISSEDLDSKEEMSSILDLILSIISKFE